MEFHFYVTHIYTGRNHIGLILIEHTITKKKFYRKQIIMHSIESVGNNHKP